VRENFVAGPSAYFSKDILYIDIFSCRLCICFC